MQRYYKPRAKYPLYRAPRLHYNPVNVFFQSTAASGSLTLVPAVDTPGVRKLIHTRICVTPKYDTVVTADYTLLALLVYVPQGTSVGSIQTGPSTSSGSAEAGQVYEPANNVLGWMLLSEKRDGWLTQKFPKNLNRGDSVQVLYQLTATNGTEQDVTCWMATYTIAYN